MGEMLIDPAPPHTRGQSRVNAVYAFFKKKVGREPVTRAD